MPMTDMEHSKLVEMYIKLNLAENTLAAALDELRKTNESLRELLLKES